MFKGFWIKKGIKILLKLDGVEGVQVSDVVTLVQHADTFTQMTGMEKSNQAIKWVMEKWMANKRWIIQTVVQLAYVYARIKGLIKR